MKSKFFYCAIITLILYTAFINISIVNAKTIDNFSENNDLPQIAADSAILIDAKTGLVIFEKNSKVKNYPASITKVMTALLAIENSNNDYTQKIKFSHDAIYSLPYNSSNIAMDEDETLTLDQALYGLLLASANEVANAISENISGTTEKFSILMNRRARELGAKNTNFLNPHGLYDENHYTTAYDMALIMKEAIKHPEFLKYISTKSYKISPTEKQPEERPLNNSNKLIFPGKYFNEFVVGGKTGYTDESRHTLVTYAEKNGMELICVVLQNEKNIIYTDSTTLFNYGFENYQNIEVLNIIDSAMDISVVDNNNNLIEKIKAVAKDNVKMTLPNGVTKKDLVIKSNFENYIKQPVFKDGVIGQLTISYKDVVLGEVNLYASKTVTSSKNTQKKPLPNNRIASQKINFSSNIFTKAIWIFGFLLMIPLLIRFVIIFFTRINNKKNRKNRKKILEENLNESERIYTNRNYRYRN